MENTIHKLVQTGVRKLETDARRFDRKFYDVSQQMKQQHREMRGRQFRLIKRSADTN